MKELIIGFVSDSGFASKIETVTNKFGYRIEWVASAAQFGTVTQPDRPGEPISGGQTTHLTTYLTETYPALLIFDLDNTAIPAQRWISLLKSSAATRRIPILAYADHVNTETIKAGLAAGCDQVVTRGELTADLPTLIKAVARKTDNNAIKSACEQPLSALAQTGIDLFNQKQFYEAHHSLEDAWNGDKTPARELYRAILQVAVAYYQIERGNYRGAVKMFLRVRQWLEPLPERCRGVDIKQLRQDVTAAHTHLTDLGADRIAQFDHTYFKPISTE